MQVLLAQAPFRDTFGYSMPPPGLLRLGGELRRRGLDVELEDLAFRMARGELANGSLMCESAARMLLRRGEHEVIGISVMGATLPAALEITRRLRDLRPGLRLLLGGPGLTGCAELVLETFPWIDAVVRGEAEVTLPEWLQRLESGETPAGIHGISWRDEQGRVHREDERSMIADLGTLAPYAWELLPPLVEYKDINGEAEGLTPIDSGRGCAYDCSFCTIGRYWSRRSRSLPAERLVDEIHALDDIEGARNAYLCHDIFGADRKQALEFCEAMVQRGLRPWECRARVDHLDEELVTSMGRAGCYRVLLGVESAAPSVRAIANKSQDDDLDVLAVVERCGRHGIRPILSLILGLPGEGPAELEASLELLARASLTTDVVVSLHLPNPQPGCGLHETHGDGARPIEGIPPDMAFGCGESGPERALIEAHPQLFSSWSLLAGDEQQLRHLARIADRWPPVLASYPRTWELLRRARGERHHELIVSWLESGVEFVDFARTHADVLVADALSWEQVVSSLDGARPRYAGSDDHGTEGQDALECCAQLVRLAHDLPTITRQLAAGLETIDDSPQSVTLAVVPFPGGVRSHRVGPDVVTLLDLVRSVPRLAELEALHPGITPALARLQDADLLRRVPSAPLSASAPR